MYHVLLGFGLLNSRLGALKRARTGVPLRLRGRWVAPVRVRFSAPNTHRGSSVCA